MSSAQRNRYQVDLREMEFQIFEQGKLGDLLGKEPFAGWGPDEVRLTLQTARQFATEVSGPLNGLGDELGCRVENGRVVTPPGFKEAWKQVYESGLKTITVSADHGGQEGPHSLAVLVEEMLTGANTAFNMYPGLSFGAAELLEECATREQKELFARRMLNGTWGGTMCLTEPHAGSDVGAATTKARRTADGRFKISGTKIYISGGDHDLAENVVHLVLARIEGAPAGTKGLSLFIVPRIRVNPDGTLAQGNDVTLGGIEHKMGIHANATCVLNFGENDDCYGELVGGVENEGIKQMFLMMNTARLAVGIQGLAIASSAYLSALRYAKDRKQGPSMEHFKDPSAPKVAIIEHADIRRSLLEMKAKVEGIRALVVKLAGHSDRAKIAAGKDDEAVAYHRGQMELLTPLVKAYGSDQAFRVGEIAVQVHGGAGYIRDYGVEQDLRDAKIFSIYEGTNHIQAMDLVGRKLGQRGGANFQAFIGDIQGFVEKHREHATLGSAMQALGQATEAVVGAAMRFFGWSQEGKIPLVALNANRFLEMLSEVAIGQLLLEGATIADAALGGGSHEKAFYEGKKAAALYFARNVLPLVGAKAELIGLEDETPLQIESEAFAAV